MGKGGSRVGLTALGSRTPCPGCGTFSPKKENRERSAQRGKGDESGRTRTCGLRLRGPALSSAELPIQGGQGKWVAQGAFLSYW